MSTIFLSSDGLSLNYSDNPFEDAYSRIKLFEDSINDLGTSQTETLYNDIQILIDRIFEFNPQTTKISFTKSSQEKYLRRAKGLFQIFRNLEQRININESDELHDIYDGILYNEAKKENEVTEELKNFKRDLLEIDKRTKANLLIRNDSPRTKLVKNKLLFDCYYRFALENGYYSLSKEARNNAAACTRAIFKEFNNDEKRTNSIVSYIRANIRFINEPQQFTEKDKDNQIKLKKNKFGSNDKNVFYRLKFEDEFRDEFSKRLFESKDKLHLLFEEELDKYGIKLI